jgi:hypothetical protein
MGTASLTEQTDRIITVWDEHLQVAARLQEMRITIGHAICELREERLADVPNA